MATVAPELHEPSVPVPEGEAKVAGRSPRQLFWARFKEDKAAFLGLGVIAVLLLIAILAWAGFWTKITGHGPNELFQREMTDEFGLPKGPNKEFWFGADQAGRDVFVRVM